MTAQQSKSAFQITRKASLVWAGVLLFIMAWMFILGILVGRGTAPMPLQAHALEQELQALKAAMRQEERAEVASRVAGNAPATDLGFYEALKKPPAAPSRRVDPPPKPAPKPAASPPPSEKQAVAVKPAPKPIPAKDAAAPTPVTPATVKPPAAAKPAAAKPDAPAGKGRFTVQVGAFKDAASADNMVNRLREKGYPAYHLRTDLPDKGVWYRVRVGAFSAREGAETMLTRLTGEQVKGMVVTTP